MYEDTYRMYERQQLMEATRRTQAERAAGTREALTAAARQLFAAHGFADVALETIVRAEARSRA